jgi:hypothetical protein
MILKTSLNFRWDLVKERKKYTQKMKPVWAYEETVNLVIRTIRGNHRGLGIIGLTFSGGHQKPCVGAVRSQHSCRILRWGNKRLLLNSVETFCIKYFFHAHKDFSLSLFCGIGV